MTGRWQRVPIVEPPEFRRCNVYEHTPLDPYRYGEYPRYLRPVDAQQPRWEWRWIAASGNDATARCDETGKERVV